MNRVFDSSLRKIRIALQGDGDSETQESIFLNLHPKAYRYIFYAFILSLLITQFVAPNIFLQIYLIVIIAIVPGQAIMRLRVIDFKNSILNLFFSLILSLITIMIVFLITALVLNILGIENAYSSIIVGLILIAIIGVSLIACSFRNSKHENQRTQRMTIPTLRYFLFSFGIIFFAFHAVIRLNAYGTTLESVVLTYLLIVGFLLVLIIPSVLSNQFGLSLVIWSLTMSAFISFTWRGEGGFYGYDINQEYSVANKVLHDGFWAFGTKSPYYAMLSITVLPVIIATITKLSLVVVYKTFYIAIAALIPIAMIAFLKRFVQIRVAIVTVYVLLLGSIAFFNSLPALNRQIIGTAIFLGIFIVIFQNQWSISRRKRFIVFLTFGLSFSHYSTAFLFVLIALLGASIYSVILLFDLFGIVSSGKIKEAISAHQNRIFTLPFTLLLILVIFTWNGLLTQTGDNLTGVVSKINSSKSAAQILPNKQKNALATYLSGNSSIPQSAEDYRVAVILKGKIENPNLQLRPESFDYNMEKSTIPSMKPLLGPSFGTFLQTLLGIAKITYQLPILISGIYFVFLFYQQRRNSTSSSEDSLLKKSDVLSRYFQEKSNLLVLFDLASLTFSGILIAAVFRLTTLIGQFYNTERAALQIAILWSLPFALFYDFCLRIPKFRVLIHALFIFSAVVLLHLQLGLTSFYNSTYISKVSSYNSTVDTQIISSEEFESARWVTEHLRASDTIQMDGLAKVNFLKFDNPARIIANIAPFALDVDSFVFLNRANLIGNVQYDNFLFRRFVSPNDYITKYYSPIYVSDTTRLYK